MCLTNDKTRYSTEIFTIATSIKGLLFAFNEQQTVDLGLRMNRYFNALEQSELERNKSFYAKSKSWFEDEVFSKTVSRYGFYVLKLA